MFKAEWKTPEWKIDKERVPEWVYSQTVNYETFIVNNIEAITRTGNFIPVCVFKQAYQTCVLLSKKEIKELTKEGQESRKWYLIQKEKVIANTSFTEERLVEMGLLCTTEVMSSEEENLIRHHLEILLNVLGLDYYMGFKQEFKRTFSYYNETQIDQMPIVEFIKKIKPVYLKSALSYVETLIEKEDEK